MRQAVLAMPLFVAALFCGSASAQDTYIQIETHPDLATAEARTEIFAETLDDVRGLQIGSRWYAIALGPYDSETARFRLDALKELGIIPADSYLAGQDAYSRQFYPIDNIGFLTPAVTLDDRDGGLVSDPLAETEPSLPTNPGENRRQALQSELQLSRDQKLDLQRALRYFGYYRGSVDAVFGSGTRRAMAAWQDSNGYEPTNVLTSQQREEITSEYQAALASLGLRTFRDQTAGIEIELPGALVSFDRYEPPFAHYRAIDDSGVTIILVSQTGDEVTLRALYDVLHTLEAVPPDSNSRLTSRQITISGVGRHGRTSVFATVVEGNVKGFVLIWPIDDDALYETVLEAMHESFTPISGSVLADALDSGFPERPIDLVNGIEIRQPRDSHSGFYIDGNATVLTTDKAVNGCERVTLDGIHDAEIVSRDESTGLALLIPKKPLVPLGYARLKIGVPTPRSRVAVSGYSFSGRLGAPTLTYGILADLQGLQGEETVRRLELAANPGDAGGPILDATGSLLGLLLSNDTASSKQLPPDVRFAASTTAITGFLQDNGYEIERSEHLSDISAVAMVNLAADITVLVSCWAE